MRYRAVFTFEMDQDEYGLSSPQEIVNHIEGHSYDSCDLLTRFDLVLEEVPDEE